MARAGIIQASFSSGELSPRLHGRADFDRYAAGAEAIENFIVRPEGGLMRRHGTRFAGETKDHTKTALLIPLIVSTIQAYIIEAGDGYMRFWKNKAPVVSSTKTITAIAQANPAVVTATAHGFANGDRVVITGVAGMGQVNNREFTVAGAAANTFQLSGVNSSGYDAYVSGGSVSKIYEIASPYMEADLASLFWTQSADTLYLTHPNHTPRTLVRVSDTSWTLSTINLKNGPFATLNTDDTQHVMCAVTGSNYDPGDTVTLYSNKDIWVSGHVGSHMFIEERYPADNAVSPWTNGVAGQSVTAGTQVSNAGNVYEDTGEGSGLLGTIAPTHTDGEAWDNYIPVSNHYHKWRYLHSRRAIIEITAFVDAKQVSGIIRSRLPNGLVPIARTITNVTSGLGRIKITSSGHGFGVGDFVRIENVTGTIEANGDWRIINTTATTFELEGSTFTNAFTGGGTAKRFPTYLWRHGAFSTARGFPRAVAIHEQRLCYANTQAQPFGFWASRAGDYVNFLPGTKDDDALDYNIAANQVDAIRWIASANDLLIGTLAQEHAAFGGGLGDPITPSNTRIVPQSGEGSGPARPIKAGGSTVFINRAGRKMFTLGYRSDVNSYVAEDMIELAEQLTLGKTVTPMAWAKNPASLLWALRSDGSLIAMTYRPEQRVYAWTRQPMTNAIVESIAVIPSPDGTTDDLWMVVNRTINGVTKRYIEYLAPPFEPISATDKGAMGYVDSALQYSGAPVTAVSGLYHLEGQTLRVVTGATINDGAVHPDRTVANGKITLDSPAANVWAGLGYTSRVRTLRPEAAAMGTAQGKTKRTPRLTVRVMNAIGGLAGPADETQMEELVKRDASDPMDASPPMRTGDFDVYLASDFDTDARLSIVQADPMPLDVLAIMPLLSVSEG